MISLSGFIADNPALQNRPFRPRNQSNCAGNVINMYTDTSNNTVRQPDWQRLHEDYEHIKHAVLNRLHITSSHCPATEYLISTSHMHSDNTAFLVLYCNVRDNIIDLLTSPPSDDDTHTAWQDILQTLLHDLHWSKEEYRQLAD